MTTTNIDSAAELLSQAKAGDFAAFQTLIGTLQPRVFGLAMRIVRSTHDAEDVTQQTFVALIEHIDSFREESSLSTWVLKIATNFALKILRKRKTVSMSSFSEITKEDSYGDLPHPEFIAPWTETAQQIAERHEFQDELERALDGLDEKYRSVFLLRDVEQLSVRETSEALGLTESTVKVRLLRARLMLREEMTRRFGDPNQALQPDHKHE
ncbi:RNA polymerase sigma factor [Pirellulaceae bacterium SH449]